jgi:hypothetical protein
MLRKIVMLFPVLAFALPLLATSSALAGKPAQVGKPDQYWPEQVGKPDQYWPEQVGKPDQYWPEQVGKPGKGRPTLPCEPVCVPIECIDEPCPPCVLVYPCLEEGGEDIPLDY